MSEYWIFLIPNENQSREYKTIINSLSKKYNMPDIDPHITLLGPLKTDEKVLIHKVERIIKDFKKMEVGVFGVNYSNTVSQCVFAQIIMSPQLLELYKKLESDLQYSSKSPFFPHISLLYGDLSPEEKANIASQVKVENELELDRLIIFRDGPLPNEWTNVAEFELS
jgi:2'-5' RNA ligase